MNTPVVQLDYDTGEEIEVYESLNKAAHDNYIDPASLYYALNKAGGYLHTLQLRFKYLDRETKSETHNLRRAIWQVDYETGEKLKHYDSLTAASKHTGVSVSSIRRALLTTEGKTKHKKLRFVEDKDENKMYQ